MASGVQAQHQQQAYITGKGRIDYMHVSTLCVRVSAIVDIPARRANYALRGAFLASPSTSTPARTYSTNFDSSLSSSESHSASPHRARMKAWTLLELVNDSVSRSSAFKRFFFAT